MVEDQEGEGMGQPNVCDVKRLCICIVPMLHVHFKLEKINKQYTLSLKYEMCELYLMHKNDFKKNT